MKLYMSNREELDPDELSGVIGCDVQTIKRRAKELGYGDKIKKDQRGRPKQKPSENQDPEEQVKGWEQEPKDTVSAPFFLSLPHDGRNIKPPPMKMRADCWSHFELRGNRSSEANIIIPIPKNNSVQEGSKTYP